MKNKKMVSIIIFVVAIILIFLSKSCKGQKTEDSTTELLVGYGNIENKISTTGTVEPQNRLEIMPPIAGRIEEILVKEGQFVKEGDVLALMSSTERAALLDAAHLKGADELKYWEKVYNATPLIAPIDGEVIVRSVEPGQTVVSSDPIIVLSDRLIVQGDVDETDIGLVKVGSKAVVSLDAYPEIVVGGIVDHISYESTVTNNVTIYEVDILPDTVPDVFRSGMSANVDIVTESKDNVLLIPSEAVINDDGDKFVLLKTKNGKIVTQKIFVGMTDDNNIEIISGLVEGDTIMIKSDGYVMPSKKESGSNPFMPKFNNDKKENKK